MNLREEILREHSKVQTQKLADWIGDRADRLHALVRLLLQEEYRIVQRAAWVLSVVAEQHPQLIQPHLESLVQRMEDAALPVAVKRNVMRLLHYVSIPEQLHGRVMDTAFRQLESPEEAVAVRVYSMAVLAGLARIYPDIKAELRMVVDEVLAQGGATPAFRARAKKVLKELAKA